MAKAELFDQAVAAGLIPADVDPGGYTVADLEMLLAPATGDDAELVEAPAWEGSASATEPIVAPDGHVVLSQADIDAGGSS